MKTNYNLPKTDNYIGKNSHNDNDCCALFPRGEHPDRRSDSKFIALMRERGLERTNSYDHRGHKIPVRCVNTGEVFASFGQAEKHFRLSYGSIGYHIKNGRQFRYRKDLKFELV